VVESYSYDSQNRLAGYSSPTTSATYAYDALDRRIAKTVDGTVTAYVYDISPDDPLAHDDILLEFDASATPAILTRRWAHSDSVDEPLGFEAYNASGGAGTGTERAVFADRQGSVIWVTDPATGDVVAAYEYDGFGQITQTQGALSQPYGYTGREYDAESGLYYYRARNYDPANGVFLQSDPIGFGAGTLAIYGYVDQNPFTFSDSSGLAIAVDGVMGMSIRGAAAGAQGWKVGNGVVTVAEGLLKGLATVTTLIKAYDAATGFPDGQEPNNCDQKGSDAYTVRRQLRKAYKPLESMKRSCDKLTWDTASDVMERMIRARRGYKLAALRKLELALCHDGGDDSHRKHLGAVDVQDSQTG